MVSGRSTWRWRAAAAGARARRRYVRVQSALRDAHSDLAALHFANFLQDADDTDTSEAQEPGKIIINNIRYLIETNYNRQKDTHVIYLHGKLVTIVYYQCIQRR